MKKLVALLLVLVMAFALCACGDTNEPATTTAPPASNTEAPANTETDAPETEAPAAVWPNGEVTILAGYEVGSLTDVNIRTTADWIKEKTGADVVVENNAVGGGANLITKLADAEPDGQTMMLIGMNCISNYYTGTWTLNPADFSKFKIVCGSIQPLPESGTAIVTQADAPYSTWEELVAYTEEHPGEVTVASIAGKVMDIKMKALFNATGVSENIRWVSTTSADATAALLGDNIDIVMFDEVTMCSYIQDGSCKAILNCRNNDDYSLYDGDPLQELIMSVPTALDVLGEELCKTAVVPNRSMFVVPAGTPDEICEQIAACIDAIDEETEGEWYDRCRVNGGTSKYYTWPGDEIEAEWTRLDPVIKEIVEMG